MTALAVKLDENLGRLHVEILHRAGYSADRVYDQGLSGATDPAVWQHVTAHGLFFITLDLGFADARRLPGSEQPGVLLLRPRNRSGVAVQQILERVLGEHRLETLQGCPVVADVAHTRIRRPGRRPDA